MPSPASPSAAALGGVLSSVNADYLADLYLRWLDDPASVDRGWAAVFAELGDEAADLRQAMAGASWGEAEAPLPETPDGQPALAGTHPTPAAGPGNGHLARPAARGDAAPAANGAALGPRAPIATTSAPAAPPVAADGEALRQEALFSIRALMLVRAFRVRGHLSATLDPLGLKVNDLHDELDHRTYGFTDADLDRPIWLDNVLGFEHPTLRQILTRLQRTYCGNIGVEFMHIQDPEQKRWIQERIEGIDNETQFTDVGKKAILQRLTQAEAFENVLHIKYPGTKRFGLDGGEAMVPALEQILKRGSQLGVEEVVLGMAHRGRLNVLANVMGKPFVAIFSEFQGMASNPDDVQGSGDVKYHLGTSSDREFDGATVHLSLTPNPSHLEAVNPVVLGKVRAKLWQHRDQEKKQKVLGILIHGDAAFAGQGLVAETLALSELRGYRTGGTIHFVINNQIGFTTSPADARSGPHPTDVALMIQAPIFHVNGDDPEAVVHVSRIAIEFRQRFGKDVVIDMVCYRRYGHNEGDEPKFTQPIMYDRIGSHPTTRDLYARQLVTQGILSQAEADAEKQQAHDLLGEAHDEARNYRPNRADWLEGKWSGLTVAPDGDRRGRTAVDAQQLREVGRALTRVPEGFNLNTKLQRLFRQKQQMLQSGQGIDWATAEALAFGTLLVEGIPVRLSGQDSGRGTFSQRHSVLYDQSTGEKYVPLNHIREGEQAAYEVIDSPLSEAAVLGFEYGYASAEPRALILWEAQFGDFVNGAQVIIDQFIVSGEVKWLRMNGLVMLLPHGYEGQGPEHSSARLERFLQQCAEDNIQVANCTTPANYFHILRRQVLRPFRKPLILMTPKSLLRHKAAISPIDMFTGEETFHRVLWDDRGDMVPSDQVRRVLLCTGKVYYDLAEERDRRGINDIVILRLEQLYPFPSKVLAAELAKYPNAEVLWVQEEPWNMGAWSFVDRRIETVLTELDLACRRPRYVGRPEAAATATGLLSRHQEQQQKLVDAALRLT